MTFDVWLKEVQKLCPDDFEYFSEWYSFYTAWVENKTPMEAYTDCRDWILA